MYSSLFVTVVFFSKKKLNIKSRSDYHFSFCTMRDGDSSVNQFISTLQWPAVFHLPETLGDLIFCLLFMNTVIQQKHTIKGIAKWNSSKRLANCDNGKNSILSGYRVQILLLCMRSLGPDTSCWHQCTLLITQIRHGCCRPTSSQSLVLVLQTCNMTRNGLVDAENLLPLIRERFVATKITSWQVED